MIQFTRLNSSDIKQATSDKLEGTRKLLDFCHMSHVTCLFLMKIINRSATFDYTIGERIEAGIKLTGPEVKSIKTNRASLTGAFVRIVGFEAFLVNAQIQPYEFARVENFDPRRTRKLLLGKKEIITLKSRADTENVTLVPLSLYDKHGLIKVEVGVGKGKKQYEKREKIKKRTEKRELERQYRGKVD